MNCFENNCNKLLERMEDGSVAVLFNGRAPYKRGDEQYPFSPDRNFYYVTGIEREACIFFCAKQGGIDKAYLYIPRDNGDLAKWVGANMTVAEAKEISGIEDVFFIDEFRENFAAFIFKNNILKLYVDLENQDWTASSSDGLAFANEVKGQFPALELVDVYPIFGDLRLLKDAWELTRMRRAMDITRLGFLEMMKNAKPGMKEYEIEAHFDFVLTKNGVRQKAFQSIAAAGKNGTILHYVNNDDIAADGDLVLVDAGAQVDWYNADITRTFPVNGKFSPKQAQVYNIVLAGQQKVIDAIKPGIAFTRLNEILKEHYLEELRRVGLVKEMEDVTRYYYHGVSHYLGAETHDIGRYIDRQLQPGMVLTVEPGLYIEEWEIGIRIEDDVLVTEDGCEIMTKEMIRTVDEIEAFMARGNRI